jgi:hypothetical protein
METQEKIVTKFVNRNNMLTEDQFMVRNEEILDDHEMI